MKIDSPFSCYYPSAFTEMSPTCFLYIQLKSLSLGTSSSLFHSLPFYTYGNYRVFPVPSNNPITVACDVCHFPCLSRQVDQFACIPAPPSHNKPQMKTYHFLADIVLVYVTLKGCAMILYQNNEADCLLSPKARLCHP